MSKTKSAVDAILDQAKKRADYKGPRDWEAIAEKHGKPTTYRLPDELRQAVKARAELEGVNVSALAAFLLQHGLSELEAGKLKVSSG